MKDHAGMIKAFLKHTARTPDGCLLWTGCRSGDYGRVGFKGKVWTTHRLAFFLEYGPIPDGLVVRHKCDNPLCVDPTHLETGTHKDNSQDMVKRGRANGPKGERAGNHVLKARDVSEIKRAILNGTCLQVDLAAKYKCSISTIRAIRWGVSWAHVTPFLKGVIPNPCRRFTNQDYLDIRQSWRDGAQLRQLAERYKCRVDMIQSIISGKRGKLVPVGRRVKRQNKPKHSLKVRALIRRRYAAGEKQIALAREFGLSKNGIWNLIHAAK